MLISWAFRRTVGLDRFRLAWPAAQVFEGGEARFGAGSPPEAIYLTHGHFDHAGSALELAERWDVPIFAHRLELPYLTGRSGYPPPDPTIGGAFAFLSRFMPYRTRDLRDRIRELPSGNCQDCRIGNGSRLRGIRPGTSLFFAPLIACCSRETLSRR